MHMKFSVGGDGVDGVVDDAVQLQAVRVGSSGRLFVHVDIDLVDPVCPQEFRLLLKVPRPRIDCLPFQPQVDLARLFDDPVKRVFGDLSLLAPHEVEHHLGFLQTVYALAVYVDCVGSMSKVKF